MLLSYPIRTNKFLSVDRARNSFNLRRDFSYVLHFVNIVLLLRYLQHFFPDRPVLLRNIRSETGNTTKIEMSLTINKQMKS